MAGRKDPSECTAGRGISHSEFNRGVMKVANDSAEREMISGRWNSRGQIHSWQHKKYFGNTHKLICYSNGSQTQNYLEGLLEHELLGSILPTLRDGTGLRQIETVCF